MREDTGAGDEGYDKCLLYSGWHIILILSEMESQGRVGGVFMFWR